MIQIVRFQDILRRLAILDEGFVEDQAGLVLGLPASRLDPKTAALLRVGPELIRGYWRLLLGVGRSDRRSA
jgi:hypothetical protein